jgi:predicted metallo-beta-lactamase superfamily hydrolase
MLPSRIELLWFDSMGAKSSSFCIHGPRCTVIVDPGAAAMQPSYPLPHDEKERLRLKASLKIRSCLERASVVVITHYHWDHAPNPSGDILKPAFLRGKLVIAKNPNCYINESQWKRARKFFEELAGGSLPLGEPLIQEFEDPLEKLEIASSKSFGDYDERRRSLLRRGREWFTKLSRLWATSPWIREFDLEDGTRVVWADARSFEACGLRLSFSEPWFHGMEYDRTGWIVSLEIALPDGRLFYTSDVMGPIIEDYSLYIARRRPDILILDGPPTYLYPYMLNKINLRRAIENAVAIVEAGVKDIIYDHHLLREARWREKVKPVFDAAKKKTITLATAAEHLGQKPLIDLIVAEGRTGSRTGKTGK